MQSNIVWDLHFFLLMHFHCILIGGEKKTTILSSHNDDVAWKLFGTFSIENHWIRPPSYVTNKLKTDRKQQMNTVWNIDKQYLREKKHFYCTFQQCGRSHILCVTFCVALQKIFQIKLSHFGTLMCIFFSSRKKTLKYKFKFIISQIIIHNEKNHLDERKTNDKNHHMEMLPLKIIAWK